MNKLLPCPFCGNAEQGLFEADCLKDGVWWILCKVCQAEGPTDLNESGAREKWNKRAPDAAAQSEGS